MTSSLTWTSNSIGPSGDVEQDHTLQSSSSTCATRTTGQALPTDVSVTVSARTMNPSAAPSSSPVPNQPSIYGGWLLPTHELAGALPPPPSATTPTRQTLSGAISSEKLSINGTESTTSLGASGGNCGTRRSAMPTRSLSVAVGTVDASNRSNGSNASVACEAAAELVAGALDSCPSASPTTRPFLASDAPTSAIDSFVAPQPGSRATAARLPKKREYFMRSCTRPRAGAMVVAFGGARGRFGEGADPLQSIACFRR